MLTAKFFIGDAGAANCLKYVIQAFQNSNVSVYADVAGAGKDMLKKAGIDFVPWKEGDAIDLEDVDLVVCGTAGKAQALWRAATLAAKEARVRSMWVGDFFGSGSEPAMRDLTPNYFVAIDDSTADLFLTTHPGFKERNVLVLGNPDYDTLGGYDWAAARVKARSTLGISATEKLVVYSASSLTQFDFSQTLAVLYTFMLEQGAGLVLQFHPADKEKMAAEIARTKKFFSDNLGKRFYSIPDDCALTNDEIASAADAYLTDYSTTGVRAMFGVPTAFVMLGSVQNYQTSRGLTMPFFPFLDEKAMEVTPAVPVFSETDAYERLDRLFDKKAQAARRESLAINFSELGDGGACNRIVDVILSAVD